MATEKVTNINRRAGSSSQSNLHRGKYPPEAFIIPGQDQNGNSVREWCRVVPLLDRAMDILFASRKFPFKSKGDLMRWCIKVGVERLEEMEPVQGSVLAQVEAMASILRDEELNHAFLTIFNTMAGTVGMHIQAQAMGEARRVISEMHRCIAKIENEYWRGRYQQELEAKFGHLLKGSLVAGAGLGEHADSGPDRGSDGIDED